MSITIQEISGTRGLKKFAKFPINLYKGNEYYVPALVLDEVGTLNSKNNPAFDFCESVYYMAYKDGEPVGRIAGIINHKANEKAGEKAGRFGFVDFIDDKEVSKALFNAVEKWAKSKGMTEIHGPLGFTDMDPEGTLVEGFDQLSTMSAIYNYPYYPQHIESMGYEKAIDWVEYKIKVPECVPEKHQRISDIVQRKYNLRILKFKSASDVYKGNYGQKIFDLINDAYADLYGYSTLSQRQIDYYVKMYIPLLRLENVTAIVDEQDDLIAVGIAIPSLSKALQKSKGRLFPFGFIHLLKALNHGFQLFRRTARTVQIYLIHNLCSCIVIQIRFSCRNRNPVIAYSLPIHIQKGNTQFIRGRNIGTSDSLHNPADPIRCCHNQHVSALTGSQATFHNTFRK